ncbi:MAG: penicillin acylase family protein, partial [Propionibacteriales bacterium]|nr:penicillin acylase family protein [Propionibacteriales bacterium]
MRRFLTVIAGLLAVVLIGASIFAVITTRKSFPSTTGNVELSGLTDPVQIMRDEHGIPQIYAENSADLFFAQGYTHAQDRFFEMDFRRHVTSGRLSELFGTSALETDKFVRTLGWRRVAEQEVADLDAKTLDLVEAYARGVNAYIDGKSGSELSLEYAVLSLTGPDYRPEPWVSADSVAWIKAMAWDLASNMDDEISRVLIGDKVGDEEVEQLYPEYPYKLNEPIVTQGTVARGTFDQDAEPRQDAGGPTSARAAVAALEQAGGAADKLPVLLGTGDGIG